MRSLLAGLYFASHLFPGVHPPRQDGRGGEITCRPPAKEVWDAEQSLKPLPINDLLATVTLAESAGPLQPSPDGRWVAYVIDQPSLPAAPTQRPGTGEPARAAEPGGARVERLWVLDVASRTACSPSVSLGRTWAPAWSPDGARIAFLTSVSSRDLAQEQLWVWEIRARRLRQVSAQSIAPREFAQSSPLQWSRDGQRVLAPLPSVMPATPSGRRNSASSGTTTQDRGPTVTVYRSGRQATTDTSAVPGGWSMDLYRGDLAWISVATGAVDRVATNVPLSGIVRLSPDGQRIAYTSPKRFERLGSQQVLYDLVVIDGHQPRVVASHMRLGDGSEFSWSPAGDVLAYRETGLLANGELGFARLGGEAPVKRSVPWRRSRGVVNTQPLWDPTGTHVFFVNDSVLWRVSVRGDSLLALATVPGHRVGTLPQRDHLLSSVDSGRATLLLAEDLQTGTSAFVRVDLTTGQVRRVTNDAKHYGGHYGGSTPRVTIAVSDDGGLLVYAAEDAQHAADLCALAPDGRPPRRLTALNPRQDALVMGTPRHVGWRSIDGDSLNGIVLLPAGYVPGRTYPLLVRVYGGERPSEEDATLFGLADGLVNNLQLWATRGYAVLLPDMPSPPDGFRVDDLLKMVLPGVDRVVELGIADPRRLGLMGHSFGGYNTIALLTQTTRFRAAMASAGFADLIASYGEMGADGSTIGMAILEQLPVVALRGTPWEQRARYLENSPIFRLDRIETPLLIVHGGVDETVAPFLADEVFVGLRRLGRDVVYAKYAGESHSELYWSYANQVDYLNRAITWFDEHLKDTPAHM